MKTFILHAALAVATLTMSFSYGQEVETKNTVEVLKETKKQIIAEEKAALKKTVEQINLQLENNEITSTEADKLKSEAAQKHALNIDLTFLKGKNIVKSLHWAEKSVKITIL